MSARRGRGRDRSALGFVLLLLIVSVAPRGAAAGPGPAGSGVALSVFEPVAGGCRWSRVEARAGRRQVVAVLPGDCRGARVGFSPQVDQSLVWFDPSLGVLHARPSGIQRDPPAAKSAAETPQSMVRWYRVSLPAGRPIALPAPPRGRLVEAAFSAKGRPLALTLEPSATLEVDGRILTAPAGEGLTAIARAYQLQGGRWTMAETRATRQGADLSAGIAVLTLAANLGPRSRSLRSVRPAGQPVDDPALLARLRTFAPDAIPDDQSRWLRLRVGAGELLVWQTAVEQVYSTGRMAFRVGDQIVAPPAPGFGPADLVALAADGDYLLVAAYEDGSRPRLYDLARGALVTAFEEGHGASLWPNARR